MRDASTATGTLVHPPETSVRHDFPPQPGPPAGPATRSRSSAFPGATLAETFRHSGWAHDRRRVYDALFETMQSVSRLQSFLACGANAYVYRTLDEPPAFRIGGSACHDRFCMPCTRERGQAIAANILDILGGRPARFITLTLQTQGLSLREAITKLQHAFRRLQRSNLWRGRVTGGAAFLETKFNPSANRWHPHVHAIVQGAYIPHEMLKATWLQITGDSSIVRIQLVRSTASVLRYVTTYAAKTLRSSDFPTHDSLREGIRSLHRVRLARTFGDWRGTDLTHTEPDGTWIVVDSLQSLLQRARQGELEARAIIAALHTAAGSYFLNEHPARPPPAVQPCRPAGGLQARFDFIPAPIV